MATNQLAFNATIAAIQNNQATLSPYLLNGLLDLASQGITDADCVLLTSALRNNTSVRRLELSSNSISSNGATVLAGVLQVNTTLRYLSFNSNIIGNDGATALASALQVNTTLQNLELQNNNISHIGAISLAAMLKINNSLAALGLFNNQIGDIGTRAIASALRENISLTDLGMENNSIGQNGMESLAAALKINNSLKALYFWGNPINDAGAIALAGTLKVNRSLRYISLWSSQSINTGVTNIGAQALLTSLTNNYSLTEFYLVCCDIPTAINQSLLEQINILLARNLQCAAQATPYLQCPILLLNPLPIQNGARLPLNSSYLRVTNVQRNTTLIGNFTVTDITHGQFLNASLQPITQFTQDQVNASSVYFQHDGSGIAPSFNISAMHENFSTWPISSQINFTNSSAPSAPTTGNGVSAAIIAGVVAGVGALGVAMYLLNRHRKQDARRVAIPPETIQPFNFENPTYRGQSLAGAVITESDTSSSWSAHYEGQETWPSHYATQPTKPPAAWSSQTYEMGTGKSWPDEYEHMLKDNKG